MKRSGSASKLVAKVHKIFRICLLLKATSNQPNDLGLQGTSFSSPRSSFKQTPSNISKSSNGSVKPANGGNITASSPRKSTALTPVNKARPTSTIASAKREDKDSTKSIGTTERSFNPDDLDDVLSYDTSDFISLLLAKHGVSQPDPQHEVSQMDSELVNVTAFKSSTESRLEHIAASKIQRWWRRVQVIVVSLTSYIRIETKITESSKPEEEELCKVASSVIFQNGKTCSNRNCQNCIKGCTQTKERRAKG